jgi:2-methylaconitate cis-trans-isomerase PrpF
LTLEGETISQQAIPAVFMRGGTGKALMQQADDLPPGRDDWPPLFTAAMGTSDASTA